eukprot:6176516-Pleurochrysis_carterae.AAC.1
MRVCACARVSRLPAQRGRDETEIRRSDETAPAAARLAEEGRKFREHLERVGLWHEKRNMRDWA